MLLKIAILEKWTNYIYQQGRDQIVWKQAEDTAQRLQLNYLLSDNPYADCICYIVDNIAS